MLWVAFELGRLFGPPSDAAFQRRVILAALGLLERRDGPVRIEDFPEEDRRAQPDAGGLCPRFPRPGPALGDRLVAEIDALKGAHDRWLARRRTTVGLSGLGMPEIGRYLAAWLSGPPPASPREGYSSVTALGVAVDDHLEATAGDGRPSCGQLGDCYGLGWLVIRCVGCRIGSPNQCRR